MVKIYTKGGDKGQTGLFSGERVSKDHPLVNAYGTVDELNSVIGLARSSLARFTDYTRQSIASNESFLKSVDDMVSDASLAKNLNQQEVDQAEQYLEEGLDMLDGMERLETMLHTIQLELFELGAELASGSAGQGRITDAQVERFEQWIDELTAGLPELKNFILPTGHPVAAFLHQARTVSRRAERMIIAARDEVTAEGGPRFDDVVIRYMNRLADLLFVLAREANRVFGVEDEPWRSPKP